MEVQEPLIGEELSDGTAGLSIQQFLRLALANAIRKRLSEKRRKRETDEEVSRILTEAGFE